MCICVILNYQIHLYTMSKTQHKQICFNCNSVITITRNTKIICCTQCQNISHSQCIDESEGNENNWKCNTCTLHTKTNQKPNNKNKNLNFTQLLDQVEICTQKEEPSNKDIINIMKGMIESQQFLSYKFDSFESAVKSLQKENNILKSTVSNLETRIDYLETEINKIQQQKLNNHIVITGIPTTEDTNINQSISKIMDTLQMNLSTEDIMQTRIMKSKNSKNLYAPILIEFRNNNTKTLLLEKIKTNGPILAAQLNVNSNKKINIHEYLSDFNKNLLQEVRKLKSEFDLKFVWYKHGYIWARKTTTSSIFRISGSSDINELKNHLRTAV